MDAWFSRYGQRNSCPVYFRNPVATQNFLIAFQDNEENEWERLGNDGWMLEMDEGDGLTWPWSCWIIWEKEVKA